MGRARTVWLRSMLVTAMVVQAFGFLGSAAANASKFVQVGRVGVIYNVPTGFENKNRKVLGGFMIGTTEVTYGEWYEVRMWAEKNGYTFANKGREGHDGKIGAKPTSARNEPVTNIDWHDVVLWSNAKSAKEGLTPVYISRVGRKPISKIIGFENTTVDLSANGYRLPTSNEWEMAARWLGTKNPRKGSLAKEKITTTVDGVKHYWTPGNYASGAVENVLNKKESARVAWYDVSYPMTANSIIGTRAVGRKAPNALGMYDVSGNVWEITDRNTLGFDMAAMAINGGSMNYEVEHLSVSYNLPTSFNSKGGNVGFRLLKAVK